MSRFFDNANAIKWVKMGSTEADISNNRGTKNNRIEDMYAIALYSRDYSPSSHCLNVSWLGYWPYKYS